MPVMSGDQATRLIMERHPSTVVIALSASSTPSDEKRLRDAGSVGFVRKPFLEEQIFDAMQEHLGVRYRFEEHASHGTEEASSVADAQDGFETQLASLAEEWKLQMQEAILLGDSEQMKGLINQLAADQHAVSERFLHLVDEFEFDQIGQLLNVN